MRGSRFGTRSTCAAGDFRRGQRHSYRADRHARNVAYL
ncbi:hypothetical protein BDSB_26755 [Burkholderia dolosa PC543]|nr:hypothetical protein BDSB_26755 [Burkholderia dolosa PC543]